MTKQRGIPIPDNDWQSLNIWKDEIEKHISIIKSQAINSEGNTLEEDLNLPSQASEVTPTPVTPVTSNLPKINIFEVDPDSAYASPRGTQKCKTTKVIVSWDVEGAKLPMKLKRTAVVSGVSVTINLRTASGTHTFYPTGQMTYILTATNSYGTTISPELVFLVTDEIINIQPILPPTGLTCKVTIKELLWSWDKADDEDFKEFEAFASRTYPFDPDVNPPADMKKHHGGNSWKFKADYYYDVWWCKVRKVIRKDSKTILRSAFCSARGASSGMKPSELKHFTTPWEGLNLTITEYSCTATGMIPGYEAREIPAGKVGLLLGYYLFSGDPLATVFIQIGHGGDIFTIETNPGDTTIERDPDYINGFFAVAGDSFIIQANAGTGPPHPSATMLIAEFDSDPDINIIYAEVCGGGTPVSYTVTAGYTLAITHAWARDDNVNLVKIQGGNPKKVRRDLRDTRWTTSYGALQFPPGTVLETDSADYASIAGYEVQKV